jgi:hypothetical protein
MSAQQIETNLATEPQMDSSEYDLHGSVKQGSFRADESDGSLPSEQPKFEPRNRPVYIREVRSSNLIETIRQKWSGTVTAIDGDLIQIRLEDLTDRSQPDELVTISLDEIDEKEQSLVEEGAMLFWHIGYRQGPKYPKERFSKIRFRRLPRWTHAEIEEARKTGQKYARFFHGDKHDPAPQ